MMVTTPKNEAPGELELVRRFVNTLELDEEDVAPGENPDKISSPAGLREWLAEQGLGGPALGLPAEAHVRRAASLRESLRALLLANNGEPLDPGATSVLNEIAADAQLVVRFDEHGDSELAPAVGGVEGALGGILAIVYRSIAEGSWPRLKACRSDTCQWAFYDHSKNRSATWCSMAVCGNRAKARTYRRRRSDAAA
jgi:predicted RNA-binding Zn ribbon-like protein